MISNLRQVLKAAPRSAVGAFNTLGIDMTAAVIGAAEDLDAPVVLGIATIACAAMHSPPPAAS